MLRGTVADHHEGGKQQKKQIVIGDFNSHISEWCHEGQTDVGGRQI